MDVCWTFFCGKVLFVFKVFQGFSSFFFCGGQGGVYGLLWVFDGFWLGLLRPQ